MHFGPSSPHADPNQSYVYLPPPAHPPAADAFALTDLTRKRKKKKRKGARAEAPTAHATNAAATWTTAMARPPHSAHSHALTFTGMKTLEYIINVFHNLGSSEGGHRKWFLVLWFHMCFKGFVQHHDSQHCWFLFPVCVLLLLTFFLFVCKWAVTLPNAVLAFLPQSGFS